MLFCKSQENVILTDMENFASSSTVPLSFFNKKLKKGWQNPVAHWIKDNVNNLREIKDKGKPC